MARFVFSPCHVLDYERANQSATKTGPALYRESGERDRDAERRAAATPRRIGRGSSIKREPIECSPTYPVARRLRLLARRIVRWGATMASGGG